MKLPETNTGQGPINDLRKIGATSLQITNVMDVFGLAVLIGVYLYFALNFYRDGWELRDVSFPRKASILGYLCYLGALLLLTPSGYRELISDTGLRYGAVTYFYPAIGFALTSFPYQFAQLKFNSMQVSDYSLDKVFAALGWAVLAVTFGIHFLGAQ